MRSQECSKGSKAIAFADKEMGTPCKKEDGTLALGNSVSSSSNQKADLLAPCQMECDENEGMMTTGDQEMMEREVVEEHEEDGEGGTGLFSMASDEVARDQSEEERTKDKKKKAFSKPQPQQQRLFSDPPVCVLQPHEVLTLLNLRRSVHGSVPFSQEMLQGLSGRAFYHQCQQQGATVGNSSDAFAELCESLLKALPCRPSSLSDDDAWMTVLAVAYLRKHLSSEQSVWVVLEAKALEWLGTVWPKDAGRSIASCVLGAMKLV